ncbi:uncharacterized protein LOC123398939 [Hordeum vulgare subsp. vulgare]|nr:uncharacterized protein LOC123398939 [Hordeum vulgare subsp. vulgare]
MVAARFRQRSMLTAGPTGNSGTALHGSQMYVQRTLKRKMHEKYRPNHSKLDQRHVVLALTLPASHAAAQHISTRPAPAPALSETISPDPNLLLLLLSPISCAPANRGCDHGQLPAHSPPPARPTAYIFTHPHPLSTNPFLLCSAPHISSSHNSGEPTPHTESVRAAMARRAFLSQPRLVLLLAVLADVVAMAMARQLLGAAADTPTPLPAEGPDAAARPGGGKHDRSIAGAEVILAGFAAAIMAVIFLYIRVTRKSNDRAAAGMAGKA